MAGLSGSFDSGMGGSNGRNAQDKQDGTRVLRYPAHLPKERVRLLIAIRGVISRFGQAS